MAKLTKDSNMGGVLATGSEAWRVAAGRVVGGAAEGGVADELPELVGELVEEGDGGDKEESELWLRRPKTVPRTTARTTKTRKAMTPATTRRLRDSCNGLDNCAYILGS